MMILCNQPSAYDDWTNNNVNIGDVYLSSNTCMLMKVVSVDDSSDEEIPEPIGFQVVGSLYDTDIFRIQPRGERLKRASDVSPDKVFYPYADEWTAKTVCGLDYTFDEVDSNMLTLDTMFKVSHLQV